MTKYEELMNAVENASSWEEKEYAMIAVIDSLPEDTTVEEMRYIWNHMAMA